MILTLHRHLKVQSCNSNTTMVKMFSELVMDKREPVSSWLTKINFQKFYTCVIALKVA